MATARSKARQAAVRRRPREEARKARNDLYRQHIVDAAEKVFAERGFDNAKVQEISDLAGLSMGTIYAIFPGKAELYRAILDERGHELRELVRAVVSDDAAPRETLRRLIRAYIGYFVAHPDFLRTYLRQGTSWVLTPSPGTDTRVQHWKEIHALQTELFRRGIASGDFTDEDPAYLAKMFSAMDQVLLAEWVEAGMKEDEPRLAQRLQTLVERALGK